MNTDKPEPTGNPESSRPDLPADDLDSSKPSTAAELGGATSGDPADLADSGPKVDHGTPPDDRQPEDKP